MNLFAKSKLQRTVALIVWAMIYFMAFTYVENVPQRVQNLATKWDYRIPFCKYFIVPYVLWFFYVAITLIYFGLHRYKEEEYRKLIYNFILGIAVFFACCIVMPNGHRLRPLLFGKDIFEKLILFIYRRDTATNIFPSLHVYFSVACLQAFWFRESLEQKRIACHKAGKRCIDIPCICFTILTVSIVLSTLFIKQHCLVDVIGALVLNMAGYRVFYKAKVPKAITIWN
ncbi:MAG: serine/threonine protein phosphatase [Lachnospiraceae bacterium]|nr:serine/threonine protein phosphatase [Lachnospiraceae bacterium]